MLREIKGQDQDESIFSGADNHAFVGDLSEAAQRYAGLGLPIFPLKPGEKRPATLNGLKDASSNPAVVLQRWALQPRANIGMATDELVVVDIDGEEGKRSLLELTGHSDPLALTPLVQETANGGWHLFFRRGGYSISNSTGALGPKIDVRGALRAGGPAGYVVLPPSILEPGAKRYKWMNPSALDRVHDLPLMPRDLAFLATFTKSETAIIKGNAELRKILEGHSPDEWLSAFKTYHEKARDDGGAKSRNVCFTHPYIQCVIDRLAAEIASATPGCQECTLNTNAFLLGANLKRFGLAAHKEEASKYLIDAALRMTNEPGKPRWSAIEISSKVADAIEDGLKNGDLPSKDLGTPPSAGTGIPELDAEVERLARLHPLLYDNERKAAAKALNARVETLDGLVKERREGFKTKSKDGFVNEDEVWADRVDGGQLLLDLVTLIRRHVVLPPGAAEAIALWILHSHAHEAAVHSPILGFNSPDMRCGKTTVSKVVCALVPNGLHTVNITPSVLFRVIDAHKPTLVIDEGDSFFKLDEGLRNLLNGGHDRESAYVYRTEGEGKEREPAKFSVWAPKVFAQIGPLPETIEDRSIRVPLKRKLANETAQRLPAQIRKVFSSLRRRAARWAADNMTALTGADPEISTQLNDRAADNWRPLFAIADLIGGEWPKQSRKIAMTLSEVAQDDGNRASLLADIRQLFLDKRVGSFKSTDLVHHLNLLETAGWGELRADKGMSTQMLGRKLRDFGIQTHRRADGNYYEREAFKEASTDTWAAITRNSRAVPALRNRCFRTRNPRALPNLHQNLGSRESGAALSASNRVGKSYICVGLAEAILHLFNAMKSATCLRSTTASVVM